MKRLFQLGHSAAKAAQKRLGIGLETLGSGECPICDCLTVYKTNDPWLREHLSCSPCPKGLGGSVPRERALAQVLKQMRPNWSELAIHESSPNNRGVSELLRRECARYIATQFDPRKPPGKTIGRWRNENLEAQSFPDEAFDIVVSLDVMEHVFEPKLAFQEIYRTLKPGGLKLCTFPIDKYQTAAIERRAEIRG
jgi:SAM-dependent methyltransferase